ncbi:MAG: hypothetical protein LBR98_06010 [Syntrophomonadaceae bacterium]|jgi:hypothetical protein|nr:hypothetical protein [Syntrophomonadaceae bacterium]
MMNQAIDFRNPVALRKMGIEALSKALTPVGMAYFLRQYETGEGNYTEEQKELLKDITTADIMAGLAKQ